MSSFSIFLPVRNGWPYVRDCVESILTQTHGDFELTILDNQSTDETGVWLQTLTDSRVKLHTSTSVLSIEESWARIKQATKREFMTMIGHDDLLAPGFLAAIQALIDCYPEAALFQTGSRLINSEGQTIRACRPVAPLETAEDYLRARLSFKRDVFGTGYVMRSADYERVGGIPPFEKLLFADDALWLLLMRGSFKANDPSDHFAVRIHPNSESASLPSAWGAILKALGQFNSFLDLWLLDEPQAHEVVKELNPSFQLTYHRNTFIYALVEACEVGCTISQNTRAQIEASLAASTPFDGAKLHRSTKLHLIGALNRTPLRGCVPLLWSMYYKLKTRVR